MKKYTFKRLTNTDYQDEEKLFYFVHISVAFKTTIYFLFTNKWTLPTRAVLAEGIAHGYYLEIKATGT